MNSFSNFVTRLQNNPWYALGLIMLAIFSLAMLAYEFSNLAKPSVVLVMQQLDIIIACIFLSDFIFGLFFNKKYTKKEYWHNNWLDFISSIPVTANAAQALRILRVWRALRVISSALDFYFSRKKYKSLKK